MCIRDSDTCILKLYNSTKGLALILCDIWSVVNLPFHGLSPPPLFASLRQSQNNCQLWFVTIIICLWEISNNISLTPEDAALCAGERPRIEFRSQNRVFEDSLHEFLIRAYQLCWECSVYRGGWSCAPLLRFIKECVRCSAFFPKKFALHHSCAPTEDISIRVVNDGGV